MRTCFLAAAAAFCGIAFPAGVQAVPQTEVIPLNYADARDVADALNALYGGEVNAVPFPPTNALLVNLSPAGVQSGRPAGSGSPWQNPRFGQPTQSGPPNWYNRGPVTPVAPLMRPMYNMPPQMGTMPPPPPPSPQPAPVAPEDNSNR